MTSVQIDMSRDQEKEALVGLVREAFTEQQRPTRTAYFPVAGYAFESRVNQSYWRQTLADILTQTEALELLAEMVGAIDEEVE